MYETYSPYNPYYGYNQQMLRQTQPTYKPQSVIGLQGKAVDSLDVVKATDIPLDGSVSYFPLIDGTAIVTKQLQQDGTSKIVVFKPIETEEAAPVKYATIEDIETRINNIKFPDIKLIQDDIKALKKQLRILLDKEE